MPDAACREAEERAAKALADRKRAVESRRAEKRAVLPPEISKSPSPSTPSDPTDVTDTLLRVRLPHGTCAQRRFAVTDSLSAVYDWVDTLDEVDVLSYVLTCTFPRREFVREDGGIMLQDVGLVPNAVLMVIGQDE
jgi:hypothetical protein